MRCPQPCGSSRQLIVAAHTQVSDHITGFNSKTAACVKPGAKLRWPHSCFPSWLLCTASRMTVTAHLGLLSPFALWQTYCMQSLSKDTQVSAHQTVLRARFQGMDAAVPDGRRHTCSLSAWTPCHISAGDACRAARNTHCHELCTIQQTGDMPPSLRRISQRPFRTRSLDKRTSLVGMKRIFMMVRTRGPDLWE